MEEEIDQYLHDKYYNLDKEGSLGGVDALYRAVKEDQRYQVSRKQIQEWLKSQDSYTLHKPVRKHYARNRVIVGGIDHQWQADLVDLQSLSKHNNGYNYLLTCIDVFSKFAWAVPLKTKTGKALAAAFQTILKTGRKPLRLQTDKGTEFLNRYFQTLLRENDIKFFTTHNETKASIVERFNRTLKTKMWRYFTWKNTLNYLSVLPQLLKSYNSSLHRSIKTKPILVTKKNEEQIWHTLYDTGPSRRIKFKFNVGDQVRISKMKRTFEKGYLPGWTEEIFTISKRISRRPPVYQLKDYNDEELEGTFYESELQEVKKEDDVYKVEKIIKQRKRRGQTEYYVKWLGYPDTMNSWVAETDLLDL